MRVAVVGAGLSGFRTAQLLEQNGATVSFFEARNRIGGRVQTVRTEDVVYDAGGEWIDSDHHRCLNLIQDLGLTRDASYDTRVLWTSGESTTDDALWPDLEDAEHNFDSLARNELSKRSVSQDQRTLAELIAKAGETERARWWLYANYRSDEGEDCERIGLAGWLSVFALYANRSGNELSAFRVANGFQSILDALQNRLSCEVQLGSPIQRVIQQGNQVEVTFENRKETFDRVVLTLPPTALTRVDLSVPDRQKEAFRSCGMGRIIKIVWEFSHPWWEDVGWSGQGHHGDSPVQQTWVGSRGRGHALTAYVCGSEAAHWVQHPDPVLGGLEDLVRKFPQAKQHFVRGTFHNWISEPYSGGGFAHIPPGFQFGGRELLSSRSGSIFFAGEHTSEWMGFFEGALESAERVANEVLMS